MRIKRRIKSLFLIALIMIAFLSTSDTYAFWASSITGSNDVSSATVQTGTWNQAFEWQSGVAYNTDDIVTFNGITYRSLRNNNTKTPGANGSAQWWQAI